MSRLLPARLDNDYRGHPLALWVFAVITVITIGRSTVHVLLPDGGAQSIATIPLDAMTEAGARGVVHLFGLWGLSQLLLAVIYVVALLRYRALVPLLYLLLIVEYGGRLLLALWKPIETLDTPPGAIANYVLPLLAGVMLGLSLRTTESGAANHGSAG